MDRRHLLKLLGFSVAAIGTARVFGTEWAPVELRIGDTLSDPFIKRSDISKVSVVKGNDCRDITYQSLMNIENEIMASLEGKKRILVKPNFV
ncbi:MAG TPA: hypothetical protein VJ963_08975, partial [Bacteroidales bacterium]|nr:hypothetical protein [Bacteroidales bacterium]